MLKLDKYSIILASQSPRRQMLLAGLDIPFTILVKNTNEEFSNELNAESAALHLAERKSMAFIASELPHNYLLITADTVVSLRGTILNKPQDKDEARKMLQDLSGNHHTVFTGVCIRTSDRMESFCEASEVHFRQLTDAEIDYYIDTYKPYDKAGSYGVQEWIGYTSISRIQGSYFNVMGLPTQKLYEVLKHFS
ncbi:MAG: Maf family nucleotide pyrophosphatase [Bacteroidales bacterium]|jgi:septum formation protein|nr:Maf family nucleotide pyrophosphatase [Bacteroidales bacterium]